MFYSWHHHGAACWDPYREGQINALDREQQKAAKFANYTTDLNWETLARRRKTARLCGIRREKITARHSSSVTVLKCCDKRTVTMVSTYHSAHTQRVSKKGNETEMPLFVIDYNHKMGGVYFKDHMYMVERKRMTKW
jgi:hypothetical protein